MCSPHLWDPSTGGLRGCEAEPTPSINLLAKALCTGSRSRGLVGTGSDPEPSFPGGVCQTGVLTSLFALFLLPLFPCFCFICSRLDCLLSRERCWGSELGLKLS